MTDGRPRNDAAMAEILASIRRIVADEDRAGVSKGPHAIHGDVLILTQAMRIADDDFEASPSVLTPAAPQPEPASAQQVAAHSVSAPEGALSVDEAAVVDIARIVLRDEFEGEFGRNLTEQITRLVRAEVARALAEQGRARD